MVRSIVLLCVLSACVLDTPPNAVPGPALSRITLFSVDFLVNGRASPGPAPEDFRFVYVKPHPARSNVFTTVPVADDGSFSFQLAAGGGDILELGYSRDSEGKVRGGSTFIEVPLETRWPERHFCCKTPQASTGVCTPVSEPMCSESNVLSTICASDGECANFGYELLGLEPGDFTVKAPDANGRVKVRSEDPRLALHLVRFENRGKRAVGGVDPGFRFYAIADERGVAQSEFFAHGDDEIVVQAYDVNGLVRSREHALYVPDSALAGMDVVGVFPFGGLQGNASGRIGIRFAPFGVDGLGLCPPSNDTGLALCFSGGHENAQGTNPHFSGGLDYGMVQIESFSIDGIPVTPRVPPQDDGNTRFTDGDVLAPAVSVVLVMDHSEAAATSDPAAWRFRAASNLLRSIPARDPVAVIATGTAGKRFKLGPKAGALEALDVLEGQAPAGNNDINAAIEAAGKMILESGSGTHGRIVVIASAAPVFTSAVAALNIVTQDPVTGREAYPVYVITQAIDEGLTNTHALVSMLDTFGGFTGGSFLEVAEPSDLVTGVATVTGVVSGAYVLSYDVDIPPEAGSKLATVRMTARVALPGNAAPVSARFEGLLELRDNPSN